MKLAKKYIPNGWELTEPDFDGEIRLQKIREDDDEPVLSVTLVPWDKRAVIAKSENRQGVSLDVDWNGDKDSISPIIKKAELKDRKPFRSW